MTKNNKGRAPNQDATPKTTDSRNHTGTEEFNALRSAYAQQGHHLHRVAASDGTTTYWAERWGLVRYLPSLHDAALFLAQIGGRR